MEQSPSWETNSSAAVVCFLLGNSPASEFYMPTFRNTLFHLYRQVGVEWLGLRNDGVSMREKVWLENFRAKPFPVWIPHHLSNLVILHLPAYENGTVCSETSAYKIQTPGNYPEESIQQTEHGESLKSRMSTASQGTRILCFLWNPKIHYRVRKGPPPVPFLGRSRWSYARDFLGRQLGCDTV